MEINRDNFEAYLLDQLEGKLSAGLKEELRQFLALNPDCAVEFEPDEAGVLPRDQLEFPDKESLRKEFPDSRTSLTFNNFDLFSIARMEGDLSEAQVTAHSLMTEDHPAMQSEWQRWQQTRLSSSDILFPGKAGLKKKVPVSRSIRWLAVLSTAAAIALAVILLTNRERVGPVTASEELFHLPVIEENEVGVPVSPPLRDQLYTPLTGAGSEGQIHLTESSEMNTHMESEAQAAISPESEAAWDALSARPLRAALAANSIPAPLNQGVYDRIRPLQLPVTPVHMSGVSLSRLAELDLQEVVEIYAEEKDFSLWSIANAGIKGINRITGSDISLFAARDEEGDISGFKFKSKRLNITSPIQNED